MQLHAVTWRVTLTASVIPAGTGSSRGKTCENRGMEHTARLGTYQSHANPASPPQTAA